MSVIEFKETRDRISTCYSHRWIEIAWIPYATRNVFSAREWHLGNIESRYLISSLSLTWSAPVARSILSSLSKLQIGMHTFAISQDCAIWAISTPFLWANSSTRSTMARWVFWSSPRNRNLRKGYFCSRASVLSVQGCARTPAARGTRARDRRRCRYSKDSFLSSSRRRRLYKPYMEMYLCRPFYSATFWSIWTPKLPSSRPLAFPIVIWGRSTYRAGTNVANLSTFDYIIDCFLNLLRSNLTIYPVDLQCRFPVIRRSGPPRQGYAFKRDQLLLTRGLSLLVRVAGSIGPLSSSTN